MYICATACGTVAGILALSGRGWARLPPRVPLLRTAMWIGMVRADRLNQPFGNAFSRFFAFRRQLGALLTLVWIPMYCYTTSSTVSLESKIISIGTVRFLKSLFFVPCLDSHLSLRQILLLTLPIYLLTPVWLIYAVHCLVLEILAKPEGAVSPRALLDDAETGSTVPLTLEKSVPHGRIRRGFSRTTVGGTSTRKQERRERWTDDGSSDESERERY